MSKLTVKDMALAALFAALMAVSGRLSFDIGPAPITLQTLVVMLAGSVLGPRLGFISMVVFIALAAVGAPVLAGGEGGLAKLVGPTGGYIVSFPVAAFVIGLLMRTLSARGGASLWKAVVSHLLGGILVVHVIGLPWLLAVTGLPLEKGMAVALLPFLPGDLAKAVLGAFIAVSVYRAVPGLSPARTS
ncbi:biotin transporter BioY [Staphylospora marina]|uniref:biotin transporter BioY n=1 Tax=Staphylospora marina TaxID=2490858 RepID=UPI001F15697A|nr:biotin transporter BioY [Staphylospora marina]